LNDEDEAQDILQDTLYRKSFFQQIRKTQSWANALISWIKTIYEERKQSKEVKKDDFDSKLLDSIPEESHDELNSWFDAELLDQAIRSSSSQVLEAVFVLVFWLRIWTIRNVQDARNM